MGGFNSSVQVLKFQKFWHLLPVCTIVTVNFSATEIAVFLSSLYLYVYED
jgi:hypothetical protein